MAEIHNSFVPESGENWALYIEGELCPFKKVTYTYGVNFVPELRAEVPFTDQIDDLPDRTKIHFMMYDYTYMTDTKFQMPRPCMMFEGEIRSSGQSQTASGSRTLSFHAKHFTDVISETKIDFLNYGDYIMNKISGKSDVEFTTPVGPTGGAFSQFNLSTLIKQANIEGDLNAVFAESNEKGNIPDIYDYVKMAFFRFMQIILDNKFINQQYNSRAMSFYQIQSRIYGPDRKLSSWTEVPWDEMFNSILFQYYTGSLEKIGGQMSFLELMASVLQLFLFELHITPTPKSFQYTLQPKPMNYFTPVPKCNLIYPIYQPQYQFNPKWKSKSTRLIQVTMPPNNVNLNAALLRRYTNFAPKELAKKREIWHKILDSSSVTDVGVLSDEFEKQLKAANFRTMGLMTEEEYNRGIIEARNVIPSYLTNVFELLLNSSEDIEPLIKQSQNELQNRPIGFNPAVNREGFVDWDKQGLREIKYFHKYLEQIESDSSGSLDSALLDSKARSYIPKRIILARKNSKTLQVNSNINHVTYVIKGKKAERKISRYYHLFSEPMNNRSSILPYIAKSQYSPSDIKSTKVNGFTLVSRDFSAPVFNEKGNDKNYVINLNYSNSKGEIIKPLTFAGGAFLSVVIAFDDSNQTEVSTLIEIMACIYGMTGMDINNVHSIGYFTGETVSGNLSNNFDDGLIKSWIQQADLKMKQEKKKLMNRTQIEVKREPFSVEPYTPANTNNIQPQGKPPLLLKSTDKSFDTKNAEKAEEDKKQIAIDDEKKSDPGFMRRQIEIGIKNPTDYANLDLSMSSNSSQIALKKLSIMAGGDPENASAMALEIAKGANKLSKTFGTDKDSNTSYLLTVFGTGKNNPAEIPEDILAANNLKDISNMKPQDFIAKYTDLMVSMGKNRKKAEEAISTGFSAVGKGKKFLMDKGKQAQELQSLLIKGVEIEKLKTLALNQGKQAQELFSKQMNSVKGQAEQLQKDVQRKMTLLAESEAQNLLIQKANDIWRDVAQNDAKVLAKIEELNTSRTTEQLRPGVQYNKVITKPLAEFDETKKIPSQNLFTGYTQVMAEIFYFYNRYQGNNLTIPIVHNPYVSAGYPGFLIDNRNVSNPKNLIFYLSSVTQEITYNSCRTYLDCRLVRKFNDEITGEFTKINEDLGKFEKDSKKITLAGDKIQEYEESKSIGRLYEEMEKIPFLSGEYTSQVDKSDTNERLIIDKTYERVFGSGVNAVRESDINVNSSLSSVRDAWRLNRREFQTLKVNFDPKIKSEIRTALEKKNLEWFDTCPSQFGFDVTNADDLTQFPYSIYRLNINYDEKSKQLTTSRYNEFFTDRIAQKIRAHRSVIVLKQGIIGVRHDWE